MAVLNKKPVQGKQGFSLPKMPSLRSQKEIALEKAMLKQRLRALKAEFAKTSGKRRKAA